ncbi:dihydrodipicolinate synthase family protein [Streptosporangium sp. NPDC023615]|uniref:dihydrodipicolinate synthase family protein n=1 Tax=Streptosporangium sp. NPDC023615 TaxID=3154794 RepID=UPI003438FB40
MQDGWDTLVAMTSSMTSSMTSTTAFRGIHVPLITPLTTDGRIATDALERLAHDVLAAGAAGIVALGTTAETATLDESEKLAVVDVCARVCRERAATLIVGAGGNDTRADAAALARLAAWPEVTAALVPVPYFTRPGHPGVLAHFTHLAAGSPVPLIVYHVPCRTGQHLDAACLRALGLLPGIAGVKYAAGGVGADAVELLGDLPPDFAVLAGDDPFVSPLMALGAVGGVVASAHLATGRFAELAAAWLDGNLPRARRLGHGLSALAAAVFAEPNPTVIKGVLHAQGRIPAPDVRLPLLPAGREAIDRTLRRLDGLRNA